MNPEPSPKRPVWPAVIGVLGSIVIVAGLAWAIHRYTFPAALGQDRATARAKALAELRGVEKQALENTGWIDPAKGVVRLRIEDAMSLVERDWGRNPAAARSNLIARVEKVTAAPPKAPEKPSEFE